MANPKFDRQRAVRILVDAIALGDKTAAKRWGVTERTITRYRAKLESDPELAEAVRKLGAVADRDWRHARKRFLSAGIAKLSELIAGAKPDQIKDVAGAVKVVGELEVAAQVLNDRDQPDHPGARSEAPPADAGAGTDRETEPIH